MPRPTTGAYRTGAGQQTAGNTAARQPAAGVVPQTGVTAAAGDPRVGAAVTQAGTGTGIAADGSQPKRVGAKAVHDIGRLEALQL
jgi:hypothetical protein